MLELETVLTNMGEEVDEAEAEYETEEVGRRWQ